MKIDIAFGYLGNGITVYNTAIKVNYDYPTIAHISDGGIVKYYIDEQKIPAEIKQRINDVAVERRAEQTYLFEKLPAQVQWQKILDGLKLSDMMNAIRDKRPTSEKLPEYRELYYNTIM